MQTRTPCTDYIETKGLIYFARMLDKIRLKAPVLHGDTLYCYSEVLETSDAGRPDAGIVRFRHYGVNQDDKQVFEGERTVLIKRRSHWGDK